MVDPPLPRYLHLATSERWFKENSSYCYIKCKLAKLLTYTWENMYLKQSDFKNIALFLTIILYTHILYTLCWYQQTFFIWFWSILIISIGWLLSFSNKK